MISRKCFKAAGIPRYEQAEINAKVNDLIDMGMPKQKAARKVVSELMKEERSENKKIKAFIEEHTTEPIKKPEVVEKPTQEPPIKGPSKQKETQISKGDRVSHFKFDEGVVKQIDSTTYDSSMAIVDITKGPLKGETIIRPLFELKKEPTPEKELFKTKEKKAAEKQPVEKPVKKPSEVKEKRVVYHGSHDFGIKPTLKKYGEGEGGQGYGYGLHVTTSKDSADNYAVPNAEIEVDGKKYYGNDKEYPVIVSLLSNGYKEALSQELDNIRKHPDSKFAKERLEILKSFKDSKVVDLRKPAKIHKFEILEKDLDYYLDYHLPLNKQSEEVINILEANGINITEETGENFYYRIAKGRGGTFGGDKRTSEFLNSIGIKGIRYLDDLAGAYHFDLSDPDVSKKIRDKELYNYTIFDPSALSIKTTEKKDVKPKVKPVEKKIETPKELKPEDIKGIEITVNNKKVSAAKELKKAEDKVKSYRMLKDCAI